MFLNNSLIEKGICNRTIGIVTDFDKETLLGISLHILLYAAGQPASRTQFPLQNAFALTVHKRKALPNITLILDSHMFSAGKLYLSVAVQHEIILT